MDLTFHANLHEKSSCFCVCVCVGGGGGGGEYFKMSFAELFERVLKVNESKRLLAGIPG